MLLGRIGRAFGREATLDDVPDEALQAIAALGFDWVWLLGVWQTGAAGQAISRSHADWQAGFHEALADLRTDDIVGSPLAVSDWQVAASFGGDAALERLRSRIHQAGLRLMLDFVPNHLAPVHPWVRGRPELFVRGTEADLAREPSNWIRLETARGPEVLAHGRDPYFPGWPDTVQLDYSQPETQTAMQGALLEVAGRCDAVRCDMAMLLLPEVFARTWQPYLAGRDVAEFWPGAIAAVRGAHPGFGFVAEVYWNLEDALLSQGFDWAYDKALYDALRVGDAAAVRGMLSASPERQRHLARFLENHDEPRAASSFGLEPHKASALLALTAPGLRLLHQGQLEGARVHIPVHLARGPDEPVDATLHEFYLALMAALRDPVLDRGSYRILQADAAWDGNPSHAGFVVALWTDPEQPALPAMLLVVNFAPGQGQCRVRFDEATLAGRTIHLADRMSPARYERSGDALLHEGLYLDLPGWGANLFGLD